MELSIKGDTMLKVTLFGEDIFGKEFEEVRTFTEEQYDLAIQNAEDYRRGSSTQYMTSIEQEALGRLTGYGSVNLPAYIIEDVING